MSSIKASFDYGLEERSVCGEIKTSTLQSKDEVRGRRRKDREANRNHHLVVCISTKLIFRVE